MIACPECGRNCSDRAPQCPQCGYPIAQHVTPGMSAAPQHGSPAPAARATPPPIPHSGSRHQQPHSPLVQPLAPPKAAKSVWQTNVGVPLLIVVLLGAGGYYLYQRGQRSQQNARGYSPTTTQLAPAATPNGNVAAAAGQVVVNEFSSLADGRAITFRVPAGHYRIRVTASNNGIKARWVGVSCAASPSEQRVYEATCDPAAEVQFVVENPTAFGLGASEQVSINVVTR